MEQVVVVLEWQFSPPEYFEETINITRDDYTMIIGDGKVERGLTLPFTTTIPPCVKTCMTRSTAGFLAFSS
jgi:hypothetical protein